MKGILLEYKVNEFQALNSDSLDITMKIEKKLWFNRTKIEEVKIEIPSFCNFTQYFKQLDELINNKKIIKL